MQFWPFTVSHSKFVCVSVLVAILSMAFGSDNRLRGAEGDPPIEIPTLQQGRALLARDILHQQCFLAVQAKDVQRLSQSAERALAEEQIAFGADFSGSSDTQMYLEIVRLYSGARPQTLEQAEQESANDRDQLRAKFQEHAATKLPLQLNEPGSKMEQEYIQSWQGFDMASREFLETQLEAWATKDFTLADVKTEAIYPFYKKAFDDYNSNASESLKTSAQGQMPAEFRVSFAQILVMYSQAKQRSGDLDQARALARQAFALAAESNLFWDYDLSPGIGGRAIGQHLLDLLNTDLGKQRLAGEWKSVIRTVDEMLPLATKLWSYAYNLRLIREEAQQLVAMPESAQTDYAKTIQRQPDFASAIGERRFVDAIEVGVDIVDVRTRILGRQCVEAARINRQLGYLYWTQDDYANAFTRLSKAALVFASLNMAGKLPEVDEWLKGSLADLYVNASLLAQSTQETSELVPQFERIVDSLAESLTEDHFGVAEGRLAVESLKRVQSMSAGERERLSEFNQLSQQRNSLYSNGNFDRAAEVGKSLVEESQSLYGMPSNPHLDHLRAYVNCLTMSGDADAAIAIYRDLIAQYDRPPFNRTSNFPWVYSGMANTLQMLGQQQYSIEALQWLTKARELTIETLGKETVPYASHLMAEGQILRDLLKDPAQALSKIYEANAIYQTVDGNQDSFNYCQGLVELGLCQNELQLFDAAAESLELALAIHERNNYQNPRYTAWNLWALGTNAFDQRNFASAVNYFTRALRIKERETPGATDIASIYGSILVSLTWRDDDRAEAQQVLRQFLERRTTIHADTPEKFGDECRDAIQWLFINPGELMKAQTTQAGQAVVEELASAGQRAYAAAGLANDWRTLELDRRVALAAEIRNESERAFALYRTILEQALALQEPPHALIGNVHLGLSNLHRNQFALDQALYHRRLARQALELEFGESSLRIAHALKEEANVLLALGDYSRAEELTQRAANVFAELGYSTRAETYLQLAEIHWRRGAYERAEQYLYAARSHLNGAESHRELDVKIRLWLSKLMIVKAEYALALETADQVLESTADAQLAFSARSIQGVAQLGLGDAQQAFETLQGVVEQAEQDATLQIADETRAAYAAACQNVGNQQLANGQFRSLVGHLVQQHETFGSVLSERQKLEVRAKLQHVTDAYVSHVIETGGTLTECYQTIMPLKGLVSAGQRGQRVDRETASPEVRQLSQEIDHTNQELSILLFGGVDSNHKQSVERIAELTEQHESLELKRNELRGMLTDHFASSTKQVDLEQLQKSLNPDEALIDFVTYVHHDQPGLPTSKMEERLLAFVVTSDALHTIPLGQAEELRDLVVRWRETLQSGVDSDFDVANRELAARIWTPVEEHLGESRVVLLSPDDFLSQVSFAALPNDEGGYLVDERVFVSVSSPRLLIQKRARESASTGSVTPTETSKTLLLMGGVDYDSQSLPSKPLDASPDLLATTSASTEAPVTALRSASSVTSWAYLPGTKAELQQVAALAQNAQVVSSTITLEGGDSTETALTEAASGATWMHLATHGFFAEAKADTAGWAFQSLSRQAVVGFDPRLLTGIVLSGANHPAKDGVEDGIFTAAEIERLDLSNTELVVLSACETALGEGSSGEGVMGLQRSLHEAGCKQVIASLWKVDDIATASLMTEFYRRLWQEAKTPAEALNLAQQQLSRSHFEGSNLIRGISRVSSDRPVRPPQPERRLPPRFWAAFGLSIN